MPSHATKSLMRSLVLALLFITASAAGLWAEPSPSTKVKSEKVTLQVNQQPLKTVLDQIESQTGYLFVVNNNVDTKVKVSVSATDEPVRSVLDKVLSDKDIYYAFEGTNIVLSKNRLGGSRAVAAEADHSGLTTVTGTVLDSDGEPAIGASVCVKGQKTGVATDIDGHFTLTGNFTPQSKLEISYVGMKTMTVAVGDGTDLDIHMAGDTELLQEVVAVGYGTQKRVNLTGAVSTVNVGRQLDGRPITNVTSGLQGAVPGLNVTSANGKPGNNASMQIRGVIGSIQGSTSPLILVDNVEVNDLSVVNPDDIESISVLKDAASASIYGIKGAFGVVLITTKNAEIGERFTISYSDNFAWKKPTVTPELAIGSEGATLALLGAERSKGVSSVTNDINMYWDWNTIDRMKEWERVYGGYNLSPELVYGRDYERINGNLQFYRSWDPYSMMTKSSSFMQTHNFSINGSSGKTSYNVGLGYMGNTGMMKVNNDKQERFNVSFGTRTQLNKWFEFHTKLMYTRTNTENPYEFNSTYDQFYYLYRWPATFPYGTINGEPLHNSISERAQANMNKVRNNWMRIN